MKRKKDPEVAATEENEGPRFPKRTRKWWNPNQVVIYTPDPANDKYKRPSLTNLDSQTTDLRFQLTDLDTYIDATKDNKSVVRLWGRTGAGNSICVHVHGFLPYFFFTLPHQFGKKMAIEDLNLPVPREAVVDLSLVQKRQFWGFNTLPPFDHFKLTLKSPNFVAKCRDWLVEHFKAQVFEANVPFILRFMIDLGMNGRCWLEIPKAQYEFHIRRPPEEKQQDTNQMDWSAQIDRKRQLDEYWITRQRDLSSSSVDLDITCLYTALKVDVQDMGMAPIRVVSFDIECAAPQGHFPLPESDSVIMVASVLVGYDSKGESKTQTIAHCLRDYDQSKLPSDVDVRQFQDESQMLLSWSRMIKDTDPDILSGFNSNNFDVPYLLSRAKALGVGFEFAQLSRLMNYVCETKEQKKESKQTGARTIKETAIPGRLMVDLYQVINKDFKLRSYSLNSVSDHFLKQTKEDVHHSEITKLFNGTRDERTRLLLYCIKDAQLPIRLLDKLKVLTKTMQMAGVMGVPFSYIYGRGTAIKTFVSIVAMAQKHGYAVTTVPNSSKSQDKYQGAKVMEPKCRSYSKEERIITLDYSSLYPSLIIAHNLCYTTYVRPEDVHKFDPENLNVIRVSDSVVHHFVKSKLKLGLLPQILVSLLDERKKVRKTMEECKDSFLTMIYDGIQLALKIGANSAYGFVGASRGMLPLRANAESVTASGRDQILETKRKIEEHFPGCTVIYIDTDSVFLHRGEMTREETKRFGNEAAAFVNEGLKHRPPLFIIFEKYYEGFVIYSAKKYAGNKQVPDSDKPAKFSPTGLESVRRDNAKIVSESCEYVLPRMVGNDAKMMEEGKNYVRKIACELKQRKVDLSKLIISRCLSRHHYTALQPHSVLRSKLLARDPAGAPRVGDRIPFVFLEGGKKDKQCELAEDPMYALQNRLPIDFNYYFLQLETVLTKLLLPFLGEAATKELFHGDHTRQVVLHRRSGRKDGPMFGFVQKQGTCLGCKTGLPSAKQLPLCTQCLPRRDEFAQKTRHELETKRQAREVEWNACFKCAGENMNGCANLDCSRFFKRQDVLQQVEECQAIADLF